MTTEKLNENGYFVKDGEIYKQAYTDAKGRERKEKKLNQIQFKSPNGVSLGYILKIDGKKVYYSAKNLK